MYEVREVGPELLAPGDVILGQRDGREWEVVEYDGLGTLVLQRDGKEVQVHGEKLPAKVRLVMTAAEMQERAVATAQVMLRGEVIGIRDDSAEDGLPEGTHRVPASFVDVGSMLAHLYLFHQPERKKSDRTPAVYPAEGPMAELLRHHDEAHAAPLFVAHVHDPDFYKNLAAAR